MPTKPNEPAEPETDLDLASAVCFVIAPIGNDGSETRYRSDLVTDYIITPAALDVGFQRKNVLRADRIDQAGTITSQIIRHLTEAAVVVADLTEHNPNVFYELAIRHAAGKPVIHMIANGETIPFDVSSSRTIQFDYRDLKSAYECRRRISGQITEALGNPDVVDNPVSKTITFAALQKSDDPRARAEAELLELLRGFRSDLARLDAQVSSVSSLGPPAGAARSAIAADELARLLVNRRKRQLVSVVRPPDSPV